MAGHPDVPKRSDSLMDWIDQRLPVRRFIDSQLLNYYAPKNFNVWYFFGSLALLVLVVQIVTGIFLTMHYKPSAENAFASVEYIMRDVNWGWLIRYMHSTGASAFFILVYLHMFRGLLYGSYKYPRELLWLIGMLVYVTLMAEAFMGYLLPWGQMSYWGAQVIINLFGAIPWFGEDLALWIRGSHVISDATLNRFFALHVIAVPLVLLLLVGLHLVALRETGSNNPDGVEIKNRLDAQGRPLDGVPFHPYYTVKDAVAAVVFLMAFFVVVFFIPEMGGYFLEHANFIPADPIVTPEHIAPVWYFTPFYSILRAVPDPFGGVVAMAASIAVLFFMPWIDRNPIKSIRYRAPTHKINLMIFAATFLVLGWLGMQPATEALLVEMAKRFAELYFLFFFVLWAHSRARGKVFNVGLFLLLMGLITLYDLTRVSADNIGLIAGGWLIPAAYLAVMLLGPMYFTRLGAEKPVPERAGLT